MFDMGEDNQKIKYFSVDELPDFLQEVGLPQTKPTLIRQQLFGVIMRSLPETELFEDGRDMRKRYYHPFTVYESIAASRLFSGDYWTHDTHAARLVQLDVFIGRLGYYSTNFDTINTEYKITKKINHAGQVSEVAFPFCINEVFRSLLIKSGRFMIDQGSGGKNAYEMIIPNNDEKCNNTPASNEIAIALRNNEADMNPTVLKTMYKNLVPAVCSEILTEEEAVCYVKYQAMMYSRSIKAAIEQYKDKLKNYLINYGK